MGEDDKQHVVLPECVEYSTYLAKHMGLGGDEVMRVAEICSTSGLRRWRGAVAFAAAYLLRYGTRASGAASFAKNSYGYLWTFAPPGVTPSVFKTQVSNVIVELQRKYPDLSLRVTSGDDVVRLCLRLRLQVRVCEEAASIYSRFIGYPRMTGKSKRGIAAGAVIYAAEKAGVGIDPMHVSRVFRVSKSTALSRAEDIRSILEQG